MSDSVSTRVGIIIPCYNHGKYIQQALDSIILQDYPHDLIRVCIVDDCSTDDSVQEILALINPLADPIFNTEYMVWSTGEYYDIQVILAKHKVNRKQAAARNLAINLLLDNVDTFCQLDADDLYLPGKLSKSVALYEKYSEWTGLVYSDAIIHDLRDNTYVREFREPYSYIRLQQENIISNAPLIAKKALLDVGLYDEELPPCEDWDLWLRIAEQFVIFHIPEALQQYTVTGQNCTFTVPVTHWQQQWSRIQQKIKERHVIST
jgi:glycosyltransferase involved in cell wall biosynthesis